MLPPTIPRTNGKTAPDGDLLLTARATNRITTPTARKISALVRFFKNIHVETNCRQAQRHGPRGSWTETTARWAGSLRRIDGIDVMVNLTRLDSRSIHRTSKLATASGEQG